MQIYALDEATDEEKICALYPQPMKNISGKKTDSGMLKAEKDALSGACKLLVWRTVEVE